VNHATSIASLLFPASINLKKSKTLMHKKFFRCFSFVVLSACLLVSLIGAAHGAPARGEYRLGVDDELEVTVANHDTLNRSVIVRPDGKISFPPVGELQATGKTASALASDIQKRLERTLNNANVSVLLKASNSRRARVLGAVSKPGAYGIKPGWRVMDLVAMAEGLTTKPSRIQGRVIRTGAVIPFAVQDAVSSPQSAANVLLQADDLVILDAADIRNAIHVVGQVAKPGAFDLEEGLNPVSLLAQAGGVLPTASLRGAHVLRQSQQIPLDLEAVLIDGKRDPAVLNFTFLPGDVLVIPENQARVGVMGQVVKPDYYALPEKSSDSTVLKVLALAGGAAPDADLHHATVTSTENGQAKVIPVDVAALLSGDAPDSLILRANDILHLPKLYNQVHVIGQVDKPGVYELKNGLTLMSLLSEAGNPRENARLSNAYVLRSGKQMPVNLHAALVDGKADPSVLGFQLQPGDVLVIPENQVRFGVMGQVTKPGFYPFPESGKINVLEALGEAGGQIPQGDQRGDLRGAGIIRTVNGQPTVIPINIAEILTKGKAAKNIQLQPNDVLYVPPKKSGFNWPSVLGSLGSLIF
jgi:protein involved in polysaccharide export with SLBB domain